MSLLYRPPQVDPYWVERIEALAPRSETRSWLRVVWEPGVVLDRRQSRRAAPDWQFEELGRWCVYQMIPQIATNHLVLHEEQPMTWLGGRGGGLHRVPDPARGRLRLRRERLSTRQWELYQETGCLGVWLWVVQGAAGGHKRKFSHQESVTSSLNGGPWDPPNPGDLPYAEPGRSTYLKLAALEAATRVTKTLDYMEAHPDEFEAAELQTEQELRKRLWGWLDSQVNNAFDEMAFTEQSAALDAVWDAAPLTKEPVDFQEKLERAEQEFVEIGS